MDCEKEKDALVGRNTVSIQPGKLDRSPCGTGCSARMAVLHAKGKLKTGESFIGESVIDSRFHCRIEKEIKLKNGKPAIVPSLRGQAWITGTDPAVFQQIAFTGTHLTFDGQLIKNA